MPYPRRNPDDHPVRNDELDAVHLALSEIRNGIPAGLFYVYPPEDPAEREAAEQAWQRVAEVQARVWDEPPPEPITKPWDLPPCPGCGYQMRCRCRVLADMEGA